MATVLEKGRRARAIAAPFGYLTLYRASPVDRIRMIKTGIAATDAKRVVGAFDLDQQVMFDALALKTATVNRKAARHEALSPDDSERVLGVARLVGQVEAMLEGSDQARDFDVPRWLSRWLRDPLPALGGERPLDLLDTIEGQSLVANTLARAESGAYA